jgi:hypothetical protein
MVAVLDREVEVVEMALTALDKGEIAAWIRKASLHAALTMRGLPSFDGSLFFWSRYTFQSQLEFEYGQPGAYYGHIMFVDRVAHLPDGPVIYIGTLNGRLIFEKSETVGSEGESNPPLYHP